MTDRERDSRDSESDSGELDLEISFHSVAEAARPESIVSTLMSRDAPRAAGCDQASPAARPDVVPGLILGERYRLISKVGAGGMGEVWSAEHVATRSKLAVKMLLPRSLRIPEIVARFDREAILLGRIRSEHVPRAIDFFKDESFGPILVTEFVEGESLASRIKEPLSVEQAVDLGIALATGVADLHAAHVVHRDLKPANVIMCSERDEGSRAVIIDLGIARLRHEPTDAAEVADITTCGVVVGTFEYIAPEQIVQCGDVATTADVYALGALLYRAVAGKHVFGNRLDRLELVRTKLTTDAPPLPTGRHDALADGLSAVVARALERTPAARYPSAGELRADLVRIRDQARSAPVVVEPATPVAPPSGVRTKIRSAKGLSYRLVVATMAATFLAGAACVGLDRSAPAGTVAAVKEETPTRVDSVPAAPKPDIRDDSRPKSGSADPMATECATE